VVKDEDVVGFAVITAVTMETCINTYIS